MGKPWQRLQNFFMHIAEYQLVDKNKDQPQCLQKCNVWGGVASREWVSTDAAFFVLWQRKIS